MEVLKLSFLKLILNFGKLYLHTQIPYLAVYFNHHICPSMYFRQVSLFGNSNISFLS